jgi:hypothetical protein
VIIKVELALPPELLAVKVWRTGPWSTVDVPETEQVVVLRLNPAGRSGLTLQPVIVPPVEEGV